MTLDDLAAVLAPLALKAMQSPDPDVRNVGIILATVMGGIDGGEPDREVLEALAIQAGLICEHRTGRHSQ